MAAVLPALRAAPWGAKVTPQDMADRALASPCSAPTAPEAGKARSRSRVDESMPDAPRWPAHLQALDQRLDLASGNPPDEDLVGRIWLLLHGALSRYLRLHAARLGGCSLEEQEDIAAQRALMLLQRMTDGQWQPAKRSAREIAGFLSRVAHNALVDRLRSENRFVREDVLDAMASARGSAPLSLEATHAPTPPGGPADQAVERREYVEALRECARRLQPRARTIWFFRVFYDMPSKTIAHHPEVGLKPAHVDVLLQRCRAAIRTCMREKGHQPQDMPPGTFAELWTAFRCEGPVEALPGGAR